jgi:hypothetical protein
MKQLYNYRQPNDTVRLCKNHVCIEARGCNGQLIVVALAVLLISTAIYYLAKARQVQY